MQRHSNDGHLWRGGWGGRGDGVKEGQQTLGPKGSGGQGATCRQAISHPNKTLREMVLRRSNEQITVLTTGATCPQGQGTG